MGYLGRPCIHTEVGWSEDGNRVDLHMYMYVRELSDRYVA